MYLSNTVGAITLVTIFLGILIMLELGRRMRQRSLTREDGKTGSGLAVVEGALFGMMGLVIAFTFSGAASRFDERRQLIVEEANDIGTACLRLDLLPSTDQPEIRQLFCSYVDTRLEIYKLIPDFDAAQVQLAKVREIQQQIWMRAIDGTKDATNPRAAILLLPALNAMFDIANTRFWATQIHPPPIIFVLLGILTLVCALLAGFGMGEGKKRSWIHIVAFAIILTFAVDVILDMEYPRIGFIRVDSFDQALVDVRTSMK